MWGAWIVPGICYSYQGSDWPIAFDSYILVVVWLQILRPAACYFLVSAYNISTDTWSGWGITNSWVHLVLLLMLMLNPLLVHLDLLMRRTLDAGINTWLVLVACHLENTTRKLVWIYKGVILSRPCDCRFEMLPADLILSEIHSFAQLIDRLNSFYTYVKTRRLPEASQISCTERCLFRKAGLKASF